MTERRDGFLYALSNPSMPGLLKIGKTTNSPEQRMSELQSTGVPTAFVLEFALKVENCDTAESKAHRVLRSCREAGNREFFRCSPQFAAQKIFSTIGEFELYFAREHFGVRALAEKFRQEAEENRRVRIREELEHKQQGASELKAIQARQKTLVVQQENNKRALMALGVEPDQPELSFPQNVLWFAFFPFPIGWAVWLGSLQVFGDAGDQARGLFCVLLLFLGYMVYRDQEEKEEKHAVLVGPFEEWKARIKSVEDELISLKDRSAALRHEVGDHIAPFSSPDRAALDSAGEKAVHPSVKARGSNERPNRGLQRPGQDICLRCAAVLETKRKSVSAELWVFSFCSGCQNVSSTKLTVDGRLIGEGARARALWGKNAAEKESVRVVVGGSVLDRMGGSSSTLMRVTPAFSAEDGKSVCTKCSAVALDKQKRLNTTDGIIELTYVECERCGNRGRYRLFDLSGLIADGDAAEEGFRKAALGEM